MQAAGRGERRTNRPNIVDRPLSKGKGEVSLSAFSFLFSELIQYNQNRSGSININDLEKRLADVGHHVGVRYLELVVQREKGHKRETRLVGMLSFIQSTVWKALFGKVADSLEKSIEHSDEYHIIENAPITNKYISIPKEMGALNCAAFIAGIIHGMLEAAEFTPEKVTAHSVNVEGQKLPRTVFLIKFKPEVILREK